ncbi:hypothetical protein FOCC_FOCC015622 [Frankliniella occidentalis]|nr:hypothetical protein FOCC_FOCC015622 [Frankliniella occidentalis]
MRPVLSLRCADGGVAVAGAGVVLAPNLYRINLLKHMKKKVSGRGKGEGGGGLPIAPRTPPTPFTGPASYRSLRDDGGTHSRPFGQVIL